MFVGTPNRIGSRIREARRSKRLTQADVQVASGVHRTDLSRIECGRLSPSPDQLKRLGQALGLALDQLDAAVAPVLGQVRHEPPAFDINGLLQRAQSAGSGK